MLFDGGGWTLARNYTDGGNGPSSCTVGVVTQSSCRYMPVGTVKALANLSTQDHVRNPVVPGDIPVDYVESVAGPNSLVIQNLRAGSILNESVPAGMANFAVDEALWPTFASDLSTPSNEPDSATIFDTDFALPPEAWPSVYVASQQQRRLVAVQYRIPVEVEYRIQHRHGSLRSLAVRTRGAS